jgi:SH3-like domain-containing protein
MVNIDACITEINIHAKTVEVVVYVSIKDKEVNAKTVEVVVYVSIRE